MVLPSLQRETPSFMLNKCFHPQTFSPGSRTLGQLPQPFIKKNPVSLMPGEHALLPPDPQAPNLSPPRPDLEGSCSLCHSEASFSFSQLLCSDSHAIFSEGVDCVFRGRLDTAQAVSWEGVGPCSGLPEEPRHAQAVAGGA